MGRLLAILFAVGALGLEQASTLAPRQEATSITLIPVSTTSSSPTPVTVLTPWPTVPIAKTIGLIMPDPSHEVYVGVQYTFGFVETGERPAAIAGGWLRSISPILIMPKHKVGSRVIVFLLQLNVFPETGTLDVTNQNSTPVAGDSLCGARTIFNFAYSYPFRFDTPGWHLLMVNDTWVKARVIDNKCTDDIIAGSSFFASQSVSVAPAPTYDGVQPASPTTLHTEWASVETEIGLWPRGDKGVSSKGKLAIGLGLGIGGGGIVLCFLIYWWIRRRHRAFKDIDSFYRLRPHEQNEFLAANPESPFNPYREQHRYYWFCLGIRDPPGTRPVSRKYQQSGFGYYHDQSVHQMRTPIAESYVPSPHQHMYHPPMLSPSPMSYPTHPPPPSLRRLLPQPPILPPQLSTYLPGPRDPLEHRQRERRASEYLPSQPVVSASRHGRLSDGRSLPNSLGLEVPRHLVSRMYPSQNALGRTVSVQARDRQAQRLRFSAEGASTLPRSRSTNARHNDSLQAAEQLVEPASLRPVDSENSAWKETDRYPERNQAAGPLVVRKKTRKSRRWRATTGSAPLDLGEDARGRSSRSRAQSTGTY